MSVALWFQKARVKAGQGRGLAAAVLTSLLFASGGASISGGAENSQPGEGRRESRGPVRIQSQQLEADMNANTAEFSGQVCVVDDAFTITADSLSIFFKPQADGQSRLRSGVSAKDATKIVARGRVVIRAQSLTASSDGAEYEPDTGRATLWGEKTPAVRSTAPRTQGAGLSSAAGLPTGAAPAPSTGRVRVVLVPTAKQR
jgi:lipopolysaccharide export system protein LptA